MSGKEEKSLRRSKRVQDKKDTEEPVSTEPEKKSNAGTKPKKDRTAAREKLKAEKEEKKLKIGKELPNVTLSNQDGEDVNLYEVSQEHPVVLFAYPRANTSGCTRQAQSYVKNYEKFTKEGAKVYGISIDKISGNKKFQKKYDMPFDLLCDPTQRLLQPLGAKKGSRGTARSQWVFVGGKLVASTYDVKPDKSVDMSLQGLREKKEGGDNEEED